MKTHFFIHCPKNGGMTIRHSDLLKGKVQIATPDTHVKGHADAVKQKMAETKDHQGYEHARFLDIDRAKFGPNMKYFAIIRNPWDRVVSRYWFAKKVIEVEKKEKASYADVSSFEAFLEERHKWGNMPLMWHRAVRNWWPAHEHVRNVDGDVACDILRFENYNSDVCNYFGLQTMTRARNVTALNPGTYRDMYTPETIQIIADWYKIDIDTWGYDFDTGPTKNFYFEGRQ